METDRDTLRQLEQRLKNHSRTALRKIQVRTAFREAYLTPKSTDRIIDDQTIPATGLDGRIDDVTLGIDYIPPGRSIETGQVPELTGSNEEVRLQREARIQGHVKRLKQCRPTLHEPPLCYQNSSQPYLRKKLLGR